MKQKEKEIIKYLRKGKRVNISDIARKLHLPVSTVRDRINRIDSRYVIKRSSLLDHHKIGYSANVFLAVKMDAEIKPEFIDFLKQQNCVNSVYIVDSGFDFLIELVCRSSLELINWIDELKKRFVMEIMSFQILKVEEKEKFVPK